MTKTCPICGSPNDDEALFCDSCGSPLPESANCVEEENGGLLEETEGVVEKAEETEVEEQKTPEPVKPLGMALGYASSIREGTEAKDSFLVVDTAELFGETKHRRILCVIVKGLADDIDGRAITQELLADVLQNQGEVDYSKHLLEIQEKLKMEFGSFFPDETTEPPATGFLVGVLDNSQVNALCMDTPTVLVSKGNGGEVITREADEELVNFTLERGDCVCLCCSDLFSSVGEGEVLEAVLKMENPQASCEELVAKGKAANAEAEFSLALTRITD